MARVVGIDIRGNHVRAALLHTAYKKVVVERLLELPLESATSLEQAIAAVALPLAQTGESIAVAVEGEYSFIHRLKLPVTAYKQLEEIVPFELEAQVPVDFSELVYDSRTLRRKAATDPLIVLAAASRIDHVRARIALIERVLGRQPERVGVGPIPLANLASLCEPLAVQGPIAILDLGGTRTELVLLSSGEPIYARTLSRGVAGISEHNPALASALAAEIRQTLVSWLSHDGEPIEAIYLVGAGAHMPGATAYLHGELGIPVQILPPLRVETTLDLVELLPRFAKAISLAVGLAGRQRDLDLRKGPLGYQRGYGFLKEKIPLLSGLGAAIFISFLFATWAELRALSRDQEVMTAALAALSKEVLGQQTQSASEATELLEKKKGQDDQDPMPRLDAFDVMVELSKVIPLSVTHDVEELDMQRGHVKINGVVGSTADAQLVTSGMKAHRCFSDAKISKITQVVNSDRQKYVLEFDVKCPEDAAKKKKPKAEPAAGGGP
jgi:general secretion pathway protein L